MRGSIIRWLSGYLFLFVYPMKAAIVTIGDEILIGQIVDTNSAWIAGKLNQFGFEIHRIVSISDCEKEIIDVISQLSLEVNLVLVTGGLGPTSDDITKPAFCKLFDCGLTTHHESLWNIENLFNSRELPLTELNRMQADVPSACEPLLNKLGTAPGMWFTLNSCTVVALPGVPFEMKALMDEQVIPRLPTFSEQSIIVHRTLHTFGLPESFLAEKLSDWEKSLPNSMKLAYLPSPTSIRLRLSLVGTNREEMNNLIDEQVVALSAIIPMQLFGYNENDNMASVVGDLLKRNKLTLSVAESCTGGTISQLITQNPGSSEYYLGSVVAYSNRVKRDVLGVNENLIANHGAVSKQVVESMADGVRQLTGSTFSIATSGIAGPDGGTPNKPVGTLWIAVSSEKETVSKQFNLGFDRDRNILRGSVTALNQLRLFIIDSYANPK